MNATDLPARYLKLSAGDVRDMIEMSREVLAANPDNAEMQRHLDCLLAVAGRRGVPEVVVTDDVTVGRRAGSAASNQYGTFAVHEATPAQVRFLARLIAEKDTTGVKLPTSLDGISKTSASALLDKLIDRPAKAGAASSIPASEKQLALITKLLGEKDLSGVDVPADLSSLTGGRGGSASTLIDALFAAPRKPVARLASVTREQAGAYRLSDGRIARIYYGQQSGRMLCAELVDIAAEDRDEAWRYLGQADRFFAGAVRLTVEECEALAAGGGDHGWCCVCGRRLDVPDSVARSIGPVCRAKQG